MVRLNPAAPAPEIEFSLEIRRMKGRTGLLFCDARKDLRDEAPTDSGQFFVRPMLRNDVQLGPSPS
jgi:hypothetical protein